MEPSADQGVKPVIEPYIDHLLAAFGGAAIHPGDIGGKGQMITRLNLMQSGVYLPADVVSGEVFHQVDHPFYPQFGEHTCSRFPNSFEELHRCAGVFAVSRLDFLHGRTVFKMLIFVKKDPQFLSGFTFSLPFGLFSVSLSSQI